MDVWRQVALEIGGSFVEAAGGRPSIRRQAGGWDILLQQGPRTNQEGRELYDITLLTAPVVNSAGLEFTVYREGIGESVSKFFGMQDLQIGDEEFDRSFICKGNDSKRLREIFADARLKSLLLALPDPVLALSFLQPDKLDTAMRGLMHQFMPGMAADMEAAIRDKLQCSCKGVLKDPGEIKRMFEIFELTLQGLRQLGIASPAAL